MLTIHPDPPILIKTPVEGCPDVVEPCRGSRLTRAQSAVRAVQVASVDLTNRALLVDYQVTAHVLSSKETPFQRTILVHLREVQDLVKASYLQRCLRLHPRRVLVLRASAVTGVSTNQTRAAPKIRSRLSPRPRMLARIRASTK